MSLNNLRIALADDHSIVRKGLRTMIEEQPGLEVAGEAGNGRDAVQLCMELQPDMPVMDIAMPLLNGLDAAIQIRKHCPGTQILLLSMHCDEAYVLRALHVGVRAYLLKDTAETDLLPALQAVAQGKSYFSPQVKETLSEDYVLYLQQRGLQDSYQLLTDREREVLQLLAEGRSNKEAAHVMNVGVSTVETHRANLMQKLGLHSTAEIVLYAVRKKVVA